jgi:hypothetical protein
MKIAAQRGFWPLRPTPTARGLELGCWLAAGVLAVGLAISPAPPAGPPVRAVRAIGIPQAPDLLAYRQHCIDRVLASDLGMTEEYVVRKINQQCSTRRRIATRPAGLACDRLFVGQLTPIARPVTGCVVG